MIGLTRFPRFQHPMRTLKSRSGIHPHKVTQPEEFERTHEQDRAPQSLLLGTTAAASTSDRSNNCDNV